MVHFFFPVSSRPASVLKLALCLFFCEFASSLPGPASWGWEDAWAGLILKFGSTRGWAPRVPRPLSTACRAEPAFFRMQSSQQENPYCRSENPQSWRAAVGIGCFYWPCRCERAAWGEQSAAWGSLLPAWGPWGWWTLAQHKDLAGCPRAFLHSLFSISQAV